MADKDPIDEPFGQYSFTTEQHQQRLASPVRASAQELDKAEEVEAIRVFTAALESMTLEGQHAAIGFIAEKYTGVRLENGFCPHCLEPIKRWRLIQWAR